MINKKQLVEMIKEAKMDAIRRVDSEKIFKYGVRTKKISGYTAQILFKRKFKDIHSFNYWHYRYKGFDYHPTTENLIKREISEKISGVSLEEFLINITKLVCVR
jgi:hypothetical protein